MRPVAHRRMGSIPRHWLLRAGQRLFLFLGLLAIAYAVGFYIEGSLFQAKANERFDQALHAAPSSRRSNRTWPSPGISRAGAVLSPGRIRSGSVIGRLEIPAIGVSTMIVEGVSQRDLRWGIGHIPSTAWPGDPGNVAIAGHRDTFFRALRKIEPADRIMLTTLRGTFLYQVKGMKVVDPSDTRVLGSTSQPALTLVTCYPFDYIGSAPYRFIVRAKLIRPE